MASINFFLRDPKTNGETLVYMDIKLGQKLRFKYSTGESVNPGYWDKVTQRALSNFEFIKKERETIEKLKAINFQLNRYQTKAEEILNFLKVQKIPASPEYIKMELDKEFKAVPKHIEVKPDFLQFVKQYIETVKFTRTIPPKPINERTLKKYRTTLKVLNEYFINKRVKKVSFEDIDLKFYYGFIEHLQTKYSHSPNTISKYIEAVKVFMREASEAGLNTNMTFESRKFSALRENVEHIYLTENELDILYYFDLTNNKRLERVRDLFLVGCYTALRFSDFTNISASNIIETAKGKVFKIFTQKTRQTVYIPIHYRVAEILNKYDNDLPRAITNQKMNEYLKELGKVAGLNTMIEVNETRGGLKLVYTVPKYELICSHTARRSAATNMFISGVPSISIMKITGHKTEKVFLQYIGISGEENANLLMNHEYFTKGRLRAV